MCIGDSKKQITVTNWATLLFYLPGNNPIFSDSTALERRAIVAKMLSWSAKLIQGNPFSLLLPGQYQGCGSGWRWPGSKSRPSRQN